MCCASESSEGEKLIVRVGVLCIGEERRAEVDGVWCGVQKGSREGSKG